MTKEKLTGLIVLIVVLAGGLFFFMSSSATTSVASQEQPEAPAEMTIAETSVAVDAEAGISADEEAYVEENSSASAEIDIEAALTPRSLGEADAPVVIHEFASLSCSHCASFHTQTYPKIKEDYINTGKVRLVFNDFPLNTPAMEASMIARCLPEKRYFKFIAFLFNTQGEWAYGGEHTNKLRQSAKLSGASESSLDACLSNEELKKGLAANMQKASTEYKVESTPSFVIISGDKTEQLRGAQSYEVFAKIIDKMLEESAAN